MEATTEPDKVLDHIQELISTPKQYADRTFEEPPRPKFLDEPETEDEEEAEEAEMVDEFEEEEEAEDMVIESEGDLEMFTGSFLAFTTFLIEKLISLMSGEDFSYDLDKTEEKNLRKQATILLKSKKVRARPQTWFALTLAAIFGIPFVEAFITMNKRIWNWFKGRKAKKEAAAVEAAEKAAELEAAQNEAHQRAQREAMEARIRAELKAEMAEEKLKTSTRTGKTKATAPDLKEKSKLDIPDQAQTKAPTLEQVREKHKAGLCLLPGCAEALGGNTHFCCNAHRIAYSGASQRKTDPYPKVRLI